MKTDNELPERLIRLAIQMAASHAEVYKKTTQRLQVEVKGGGLEAVEHSRTSGYGLRVIKESRLGFSYSTDPDNFEEVCRTAIESSKWTEKDNLLDIPPPENALMPEIYDPEIASIKEETAIEKALLIEASALNDRRIKRLRKAAASFSLSETLLYNSKGIASSYQSTSCTAHVMAVAEENDDSQMGWDFQAGRFLSDVSFEEVGSIARDKALRLLHARKIGATKSPVIIDSAVAADFLGIFASLLSSDAVQKGKSLLKGRLGKKVINEAISIIDDGTMPRKLGSRPIDDEGVPASRKFLIKEGVLLNFMYNTYTARKDNVVSTGNALRGGFSALPSISPTNLYIDSKKTIPDLFGSLNEGLYIVEAMGMHTANPISGDFSIGVSGIWIKRGMPEFPVKEAMISGNILEFFKSIMGSGNDLRFYGNIGSPSLLIDAVDISA